MPDVEKILRLVEQGVLSADEADEILGGMARRAAANDGTGQTRREDADTGSEPDKGRHLRVEITEGGRRVVNLRVPVNIASFAAGFVPGLPDVDAARIRQSIRDGLRGPIVDIATDDGNRVLIVNE